MKDFAKNTTINFFNFYKKIIEDKLNNGDYTLKMYNITVRINDRYDIILYPYISTWLNKAGQSEFDSLLDITIIRYEDINGYAREYGIYTGYNLRCNENDVYNMFSLYNKCNEIYSILNITESIDLFTDMVSDMATDLRIEKIDNLL